jgi:hypothetical protein
MSTRNHKWLNKDGLFVGFGTRRVEVNTGSKISVDNQEQEIRLTLVGTRIKSAVPAGDLENSAVIPAGSFITSAVIRVDDAFLSGGAATLDVGTYNANTGAAVTANGLVAAAAIAALETGDTVTGAGAQVGTRITAPLKVGAKYNVGAYTAGKAVMVVKFVPPAA